MSEVQTFEDAVKSRIKSVVQELIPEERWQGLVDREIAEFEKKLAAIVKEELQTHFRSLIQEQLKSPEFYSTWNHQTGLGVSESVKAIIIEAAPLMFANMMQGMVQSTIDMLKSSNRY
jgi:hypothetical protein